MPDTPPDPGHPPPAPGMQANWTTDQGDPYPRWWVLPCTLGDGSPGREITVVGKAYCLVPPNFLDATSPSSPKGRFDLIINGGHYYDDGPARDCVMSYAPAPVGPPDEAGNYRVQADFSLTFRCGVSSSVAVCVNFQGTKGGEYRGTSTPFASPMAPEPPNGGGNIG